MLYQLFIDLDSLMYPVSCFEFHSVEENWDKSAHFEIFESGRTIPGPLPPSPESQVAEVAEKHILN